MKNDGCSWEEIHAASLTGAWGRPGALFDEVERVMLLKVTALIALDDLYWRSSNRPAAAMMTIQVMEVLARPSRAVRV
jgi:hypothetical protein